MTRDEAIEYIKAWLPDEYALNGSDRIVLQMAIEALSEPKTGWIPVSERLPEIGQKVIASTKGTVFTQVYKGIYSEPNVWHWNHNSIKVVTAWMPIPEPYREDGEA